MDPFPHVTVFSHGSNNKGSGVLGHELLIFFEFDPFENSFGSCEPLSSYIWPLSMPLEDKGWVRVITGLTYFFLIIGSLLSRGSYVQLFHLLKIVYSR